MGIVDTYKAMGAARAAKHNRVKRHSCAKCRVMFDAADMVYVRGATRQYYCCDCAKKRNKERVIYGDLYFVENNLPAHF